jgi:hypothetical protein
MLNLGLWQRALVTFHPGSFFLKSVPVIANTEHAHQDFLRVLSIDFNSPLENVGKLDDWGPKNAAH